MDWLFDKIGEWLDKLENWLDDLEEKRETNLSLSKEMTAEQAAKRTMKIREKEREEQWADICEIIDRYVNQGKSSMGLNREMYAENIQRLKDLGYDVQSDTYYGYKVSWEVKENGN